MQWHPTTSARSDSRRKDVRGDRHKLLPNALYRGQGDAFASNPAKQPCEPPLQGLRKDSRHKALLPSSLHDLNSIPSFASSAIIHRSRTSRNIIDHGGSHECSHDEAGSRWNHSDLVLMGHLRYRRLLPSCRSATRRWHRSGRYTVMRCFGELQEIHESTKRVLLTFPDPFFHYDRDERGWYVRQHLSGPKMRC